MQIMQKCLNSKKTNSQTEKKYKKTTTIVPVVYVK